MANESDGPIWVVAFNRTAVRVEARVERGGDFTLPLVPPGEYGLKVGSEAHRDPEVVPGKLAFDHPEAFQQKADPWKKAKVVKVEPGRDSTAAVVEYAE
jgi:hypothetical protein